MSKKKPNTLPSVSPCIDLDRAAADLNRVRNMSAKERKAKYGKGSYIHQRYLKPIQDLEKQSTKEKRSEWWWNKGLLILNTVLALIAAITSVIALLQ